MQWVPNTAGLRGEIAKCYQAVGLRNPLAILKDARVEIERIQTDPVMSDAVRVARYREAILPLFPAVLHRWFALSFADPTAWFEARVAFARSAAAWSIVGHVIGLGDRHGENILLDRAAGECVHVDFVSVLAREARVNCAMVLWFTLVPPLLLTSVPPPSPPPHRTAFSIKASHSQGPKSYPSA